MSGSVLAAIPRVAPTRGQWLAVPWSRDHCEYFAAGATAAY